MPAIQPQQLTDYLVVGLGKTGLSCARYLARQGHGFAVADSRQHPPGLGQLQAEFPGVECFCGDFDAELFVQFKQLLLSPGVDLAEPAVQAAIRGGRQVYGDIEAFAREVQAPVLAITGSNGKSTVTSLLAEMLRAAGKRVLAGGNLGEPALDLLAQPQPDFYVLELSSFQLETLQSLKPLVATVLNLSPDHLDRHPDMASYVAAKARIYQQAQHAVVNAEDPLTLQGLNYQARTAFSQMAPAAHDFGLVSVDGDLYLAQGETLLLPVSALKLRGRHNYANVLAALAMGHAAGVAMAPMLAAAQAFPGLPHRTEWVAEHGGVLWINDSKGTNVGATLAALQGFAGQHPVVLIAGGVGKGQDFHPLRAAVSAAARAVVLLGEDAPSIAAALQTSVPLHFVSDMRAAVQQAAALALPGDCVLLSPACASFDMYSDYTARGADFRAAVLEYLP